MPSDVIGGYLDTWGDREEDTFKWVQMMLSQFSYKPGWQFDLHRRPEVGGVMLTISLMVEDSRRGPNQIPRYREMTLTAGEPFRIERDDLIPISGSYVVDRYATEGRDEDRFLRWLHSRITSVERHETDEWFRFKGRLVHDPHAGDL